MYLSQSEPHLRCHRRQSSALGLANDVHRLRIGVVWTLPTLGVCFDIMSRWAREAKPDTPKP